MKQQQLDWRRAQVLELSSMGYSQMTSEVKQQQLEWRGAQVLELASEGYTQREIASKLQVDLTAVNTFSFYDNEPKRIFKGISMKQYRKNIRNVW